MPDIYQLKENGTAVYMKTHAKAVDDLIESVYPIGAVYLSVGSTNPTVLFGGTWERFGNGRTLVGIDEADTALATPGKLGGSANPLTAHEHQLTGTTYKSQSTSGKSNILARALDLSDPITGDVSNVTAATAGNNTDHANWQPFVTLYMWVRTA